MLLGIVVPAFVFFVLVLAFCDTMTWQLYISYLTVFLIILLLV